MPRVVQARGGGAGGSSPGGVPPEPAQRKNTDVCLTWPFTANTGKVETVPTRDRFDRAHGQKDGKGNLLPAPKATGTKARQYPPRLLNHAGLSIDGAADALHEMQCRLADIPGLGPSMDSFGARREEAMWHMRRRWDDQGVAERLERRDDRSDF